MLLERRSWSPLRNGLFNGEKRRSAQRFLPQYIPHWRKNRKNADLCQGEKQTKRRQLT